MLGRVGAPDAPLPRLSGLQRLLVHGGTWDIACSMQGSFRLFCLAVLPASAAPQAILWSRAEPAFQLHACGAGLLGQQLMLGTRAPQEAVCVVQDFFGGITIFSRQQLERVNGYGVNFWGWGREDDNMRERLRAADMWPPERPAVPMRRGRWYFEHQRHLKAPEVTASRCRCNLCRGEGWIVAGDGIDLMPMQHMQRCAANIWAGLRSSTMCRSA